ncbi:sialate O-acetylesterase [Candidatus Neomarinimicrobiota bacterium]
MLKSKTISLKIALLAILVSNATGEVRLPAIISDNMLLQSGTAVRIWGWADPGEVVSIDLAGQHATVTANTDSSWIVELEPVVSGGPYELVVTAANTFAVTNILAGELWLCAGQSNMRWHIEDSEGAEVTLANAEFPEIRIFTVGPNAAATPENDCEGAWQVVQPNLKELARFTAVGYYFGRKLHQELGLPVGLIDNSWGGTPIEAWMSAKALESDQDFQFYLDQGADWLANIDTNTAIFERELLAPWRSQVAAAEAAGITPPQRPRTPNSLRPQWLPSYLYNGMIVPLAPLVIKGVIWYQGESNAARPETYRAMFETMIADWREAWDLGDIPFYYAQLSLRQTEVTPVPGKSQWGMIREAQLQALKVANTGMAVTTDIGEVGNIHPRNKLDVGLRLARWALHKDYGQNELAVSGPLYSDMALEGSKIRISFDHASDGLVIDGRKLKQIAIAGEDCKFVWAKAKIEGNTLLVWNRRVKKPVAVRYSWADVPAGANLFGGNGLPASPFRTGLVTKSDTGRIVSGLLMIISPPLAYSPPSVTR